MKQGRQWALHVLVSAAQGLPRAVRCGVQSLTEHTVVQQEGPYSWCLSTIYICATVSTGSIPRTALAFALPCSALRLMLPLAGRPLFTALKIAIWGEEGHSWLASHVRNLDTPWPGLTWSAVLPGTSSSRLQR